MTDRATGHVRTAERCILALTALAWVLSYTAQVRLATAHGYTAGVHLPWADVLVTEANLWPLTVDLLVLVCTVLALALAHRGHGPTGEAWGLAGLATAVMLAANVAAAVSEGDAVAVGLHAWPAICLGGGWHLLFRCIADERVAEQQDLAIGPAAGGELVPIEAEVAVVSPNGHRPAPERTGRLSKADIRQAYRRLSARGPVTGARLAAELGVSSRQGQRYLNQESGQ